VRHRFLLRRRRSQPAPREGGRQRSGDGVATDAGGYPACATIWV